uniref:Uncharacterized protein n=5 Tax=Ditylum brightwellii TaxID=49249 RepID=A0A7S4QIP3_9STRA|mmetsp:Transcript_21554/g.28374  ORF Transcript_21554/g.28374 Transcript_21554/m.28374 type:complete len:942 (+) Transcript_21554:74-2899(+)
MASVPVPSASNPMRPVLPNRGVATVKSVLSGDTVVLLGRATSTDTKAPEVVFTFERVTAPRTASKGNDNKDEPGAFPAREWLRKTCVGKSVCFETRKQGATAGDRVYGLLFISPSNGDGKQLNLAVEAVRLGHATPKTIGASNDGESQENDGGDGETDPAVEYQNLLNNAYEEAKAAGVGVHSKSQLVRSMKNSVEDFATLSLVEKSQKLCENGAVKCVVEHVFDGSRLRCLVTDPAMTSDGLIYGSFTLIIAGVSSPRVGNPKSNVESEPFADEARQFVEVRLLNRELRISLHGTDKSETCAVGTVHHPKGNIAVELLKRGLGRVTDWTVRLMNPMDVPALRVAENNAKRTNLKVWHDYEPPKLSGAAEIQGTVVEILTGDTVLILPDGETFDDDSKLKKVSLASVRCPRLGNERTGKPDEPYAFECKERLRSLTIGKSVRVTVNYERDVPMGESSDMRQFGTISVGKRDDIGETLIADGLAESQRHRDDDEKSARYDILVAAESIAKAAKKGMHSEKDYGTRNVNDLTDPKKAKANAGSLIGNKKLKAIVEYIFNGSRFKMYIPSENCYVVFALSNVRCPQPNPSSYARSQGRAAEPFGEASKRHARLSVHQRSVEISCSGMTQGGVVTGDLMIGSGANKRDFSLELVMAGLGYVDQRRIDYGEAPKTLVDAQTSAKAKKLNIWSIEQKKEEVQAPKSKEEEEVKVQLSEIRSGNHFFYHVVGDEAIKEIDDSMKKFTEENGTSGAPCDVKVGKVVAALFDGSWYRAKIVEKKESSTVSVLFIDHGNLDVVKVSTHLRPLSDELGTDKIPPVAKEAELILTIVRSTEDDYGLDAARMLNDVAWGKELNARVYYSSEGKSYLTLTDPSDDSKSINETIVAAGLGRVPKQSEVNAISKKVSSGSEAKKLATKFAKAQEAARTSRSGMWRYGDIGDDDDEDF